ncbi:MAG: SDR family oxidoreductase [Dehalococcoidia bacterium]|nr:SDR family oxidoreductase [Dehalococcoidia bacterium]
MGRLDGKVAVVTGSGRGIGKAIAELFAKEGASVVINDVDEAVALGAAREIEGAGGKAAVCVADIRLPEESKKLIDTAIEKFGKLDILVNNAGIARDNLASRMTDEQWNLVIDINLKGTFNCIRAASRHMMKKGHNGRIINVSSIVGLTGNPGQINYAASKSGVIGITKTVAREWMRYGVTCNAVAFGGVETRFTTTKEKGEEFFGEKTGIPQKAREAMVQQMESQTVGGGMMTPEDAAKSVLLLALDEASWITGNVLNATGGLYI